MDLSTILARRADFAPDKTALVFEGQSLSYAEFCSRATRPPHDWFATGDVGHRDQGGFYYIDDRIKDMVIQQRLLDEKGMPASSVSINFYIVNKKGEYAGVTLRGRSMFAVCDENGPRSIPMEPLLA